MAGASPNESFMFWLYSEKKEQVQFPELINLRRIFKTSRFLLLEYFH